MSRNPLYLWTTAILLWVGVLGATGVIPQNRLGLQAPLDTAVPNVLQGYVGTDIEIAPEEQRVAGFTDYLFRSYTVPGVDDEGSASGSATPHERLRSPCMSAIMTARHGGRRFTRRRTASLDQVGRPSDLKWLQWKPPTGP